MLLTAASVVGCAPSEGHAVGFWPTERRAVPAAPGVGWTRHPKMGAAERRWLTWSCGASQRNISACGNSAALFVNLLIWLACPGAAYFQGSLFWGFLSCLTINSAIARLAQR
jgi:hypothetical protein